MKTLTRYILSIIAVSMVFHPGYGQCTDEMISGHAVITPNRGCAPFNMEIKNLYSNSTPDAVFRVDWGDGNVDFYVGNEDPVDGGALDPIYTPDFQHTYATGSAQCGHTIIIEATNGCSDPDDTRLELQVSIWDTDQIGLNIDPGLFRICQGAAGTVRFTDQSDWNCFPRAHRQNDPPRFIQWEYAGGSMRIPGIATPSTSGIIEVNGTGAQSDILNIPANDPDNPGNPYTVGSEFVVRLNNWNRCNPVGEPPVTVDARIVVVEAPTPDFITKKEDTSNPPQSDFCVDDIVYFDNESSGPVGSELRYTWQFFDGPDASATLLGTRTTENPVWVYTTGGTKMVRLSVTDRNAVGGCSSVVEKVINVYPTTIAQINASQTNFCKDEGSADGLSVTFTDVSTGSTLNTEWRWEFYDENDVLYQSYPAAGFSSTRLGPFNETYVNPGRYRVVLITRDNITNCATRDEKFVNVYLNPNVEFENSLACEGEEIDFVNQTTLTSINGNLLWRWQWDFDYDGVSFNPDETYTHSVPDTITHLLSAGTHEVALRVIEDQNNCSAVFSKEIVVHGRPDVVFTKDKMDGCSPLEVSVHNAGHSTQPVPVTEYVWSIDFGSGFEDTLTQITSDPGFSDTVALTFTNNTSHSRYFPFKLRATSDFGCTAESESDSVEVFPSIKPGFRSLNYDPLDNNCSPISVMFQVDAPTIALSPSQYNWEVRLNGNPVHTETKPPSDPQFEYEFNASGINVNDFRVHLNAPISGTCISDSILLIKVNPIPLSDFVIDTIDFNCERVLLNVDARQKGLVEYDWVIQEGLAVYPIDTLGDNFNWEIERPLPGFPAEDVSFTLNTKNFTFCEGEEVQHDLSVPAQDDMGTAFTATPRDLIYPNTLVFLENHTNDGSWDYLWEFGDGTTAIGKNPGYHNYPGIGEYELKLTVFNDFCTEADTQDIRIVAPPLFVDFDYSPDRGCAPLTVDFTNRSINAVAGSYLWDFGDGQTSVVENPTYTFTTPGVYTVSLRASNAGGLTFTETKENVIVVVDAPVVDFSADPKIQVFPDTEVMVENLSVTQSAAPAYLWDFGDGIYTIESDPDLHIYEFPGEYFIKLSITENACTRTDSVRVTIEDPLPAILDFSFKPGFGCAPVTVEFLNRSIGAEESSFVWDFGDGRGESYEKNPTHTFYEPGVYTVSLRARNIIGVESVIVKEAIITVYEYPDASFTVDPEYSVFPDATVNITPGSAGLHNLKNYRWNFGDGAQSNEANPGQHTYQEPGYYTISFTVDDNGCESTDSVEVFIKPIPPVVDFDYEPSAGCVPLTVSFYNLSLYADPATYQWDFGDGFGKSNQENPVYTYYEPGIYTVSLEATNKSGVVVTEIKEQIIEVYEAPIASFYARPEEVNVPDEAMHITNRSHKATRYTWYFGDGAVSFEEEPSHKYMGVGEYDITLIAENEQGCSDTLTIEKAVIGVLKSKVRVPNAFTPNLDGPSGGNVGVNGHNDVFYPVTEGVSQYHMQIFNRWGELIYETQDKNYGWDGYHKGRVCPQDVYIYRVNVRYLDGRQETLFGDVTLIR